MSKSNTISQGQGRFIGMDLSDKQGTVVGLDPEGRVVEEGVVAMTPAAVDRYFGRRGRARIAIEAGTHSPWVSRALEDAGHEVIVANSRQIPLTFRSNRKNDRVDAASLARLARLDPELLHPMKHRSQTAQEDPIVHRTSLSAMSAYGSGAQLSNPSRHQDGP